MKLQYLLNSTKLTLAVISLLVANFASAEQFIVSGGIQKLTVKHVDSTSNGLSGAKVLISTNQAAGQCGKALNGALVAWIREDAASNRMYTMLLAAKLAGESVTIIVDDTQRESEGVCFLQTAYLG